MLRPRPADSPLLVLRFAAYTAIALTLAAGGIFLVVRHQAVAHAEEDIQFHTRFVADSILRHQLDPSDFARPVTKKRRAELDRLFRRDVLTEGLLRVKLWRRDGTVTYSSDHSLIGDRDDAEELADAIAQNGIRHVSHLNAEGGRGPDVKVLESYVPVRPAGTRKAAGVFEIYQDYAPVAAAVRSTLVPVGVVLALALAGLWISLFPILRRVTAALEARNTRLAEQAEKLRATLVEWKRAEEGRRHSEEQLRQSQKMEAVGQLAGGIAHDFNNLLLAIHGYSELALSQLNGADPATRRYIEEIRSAGERAAALTRQLLAFSRKQVLETQIVDLNGIVTGIESMLRRLLGEDLELVVRLAPELSEVNVDPSQLEQILMNLTVNARDAMPDGGRVIIETRNEGDQVALVVADTGVGMDAETAAHVFEPFFTTKEPGKGTGLGLSTVYAIVEQSGGHITVESEPHRGTTFTILLPAAEGAEQGPDDAEAEDVAPGNERVLLVEDDPVVRELVRKALRENGYAVIEAGCPDEAIELAAIGGQFDLLLTDVVMPKMNGRQLAAELASSQPEMRVLYTSGYTSDSVVQRGVDSGPFLQKPYRMADLARKVREVLDHPGRSEANGLP
jgi:signal transduction histidine kinase/CheY-like chemotaxis protein